VNDYSEPKFEHIPVLLRESIAVLDVKPDGLYIDGTAGGGGHSAEILKRLGKGGRLIAIDRDPDAVKAALKKLSQRMDDSVCTVSTLVGHGAVTGKSLIFANGSKVMAVNGNFSNMKQIMQDLGEQSADGILLDLGVSSYQLDTPERGFSYHNDAPLDMRMEQRENSSDLTASDIINTYSQKELAKIIYEYGEEKFSRAIAAGIVKVREQSQIKTTGELAKIISDNVPHSVKRNKNPCKKTFQALRIAVNDEFGHISAGLDAALECLKPGGCLAVITFHSLEDRIVKQRFNSWYNVCTCPPSFPQCICGNTRKIEYIAKKPITASDGELLGNVRSRSAKLRAVRAVSETVKQ
jgi:16S rRNA (cytosine1402-N4)-methyltransferase